MDSWESLIASRMRPCATMPKEEDTSKRANNIGSDRYEKSEKRKESRKNGNAITYFRVNKYFTIKFNFFIKNLLTTWEN